ncbi:MAG: flagellar biosynthetic protein FliQ [Pirellulaceae bacterium]|nr:flagellar biosynthetic protein FliQ [Planctomycetales bacterium]MCA9161572.1 flagellar biosynthetic protein FliQ [Planctomycetales bacterium]MCA9202965.1 flagellar biosynthetic protein FliQ [Planctomycetales bacterium]MCA9207421.1 flagellar biosynthetic protein FliQ [Planctomycetales bacterium]MCA9226007.1 flagellar biosynthetic protein FliQ [Planctomycetales bacterium]
MTTTQVLSIGRELLVTALLLTAPTVLISIAIGLVISIFQTVTSIQEQTLTFAPRIFAVAVGMLVTLPWTLRIVTSFTYRMMWHVAEAGS